MFTSPPLLSTPALYTRRFLPSTGVFQLHAARSAAECEPWDVQPRRAHQLAIVELYKHNRPSTAAVGPSTVSSPRESHSEYLFGWGAWAWAQRFHAERAHAGGSPACTLARPERCAFWPHRGKFFIVVRHGHINREHTDHKAYRVARTEQAGFQSCVHMHFR